MICLFYWLFCEVYHNYFILIIVLFVEFLKLINFICFLFGDLVLARAKDKAFKRTLNFF